METAPAPAPEQLHVRLSQSSLAREGRRTGTARHQGADSSSACSAQELSGMDSAAHREAKYRRELTGHWSPTAAGTPGAKSRSPPCGRSFQAGLCPGRSQGRKLVRSESRHRAQLAPGRVPCPHDQVSGKAFVSSLANTQPLIFWGEGGGGGEKKT